MAIKFDWANTFQLTMKQFEKTLEVFRNACLPKSGAAVGNIMTLKKYTALFIHQIEKFICEYRFHWRGCWRTEEGSIPRWQQTAEGKMKRKILVAQIDDTVKEIKNWRYPYSIAVLRVLCDWNGRRCKYNGVVPHCYTGHWWIREQNELNY